jgi:hypothetical protein
MAITGTLLADFTAFYDAAAKAETSLKGMTTTAGTTEQALDKMAQLDTAPAVADVAALDRAVQSVGTSAATTAPSIDLLGTKTTAAGEAGNSFKDSFNQVDKSLAAVGINLGPLPGAITELGTAAGKSATSLGLLGTAGLTVAAATAGWQIGRTISELTGLDDIIGRNVAKLMGWGDLAAVEAAEGARTLALASQQAGRQITDLNVAMHIINKTTTEHAAAMKKDAEEVERGKAAAEKFAEQTAKLFSRDDLTRADEYLAMLGGVENVTKLTVEKKKELRTVLGDALAAYAALGERAPKDVQRVYDATTDLITVTRSFSTVAGGAFVEYKAGLSDAAAKSEVDAARIRLAVKAVEQPWRDLGGVSQEELQAIADTAATKYATVLEHSQHFTAAQIAEFKRAADEAQVAANRWGTYTLETYDEVAEKATQTATHQIAQAQRTATSWSQAMDAVRRGEGTLGGTIQMPSGPVTAEERMASEAAFAAGRYYGPVTGGREDAWGHYVGGRIDWAAIDRMRGNAPAATAAGATGVQTNVTVNGSVLSNPQELARVVGDAVMASLRAGGVRLPAGA